MRIFLFDSIRNSLILLVLLAVLPALGRMQYTGMGYAAQWLLMPKALHFVRCRPWLPITNV